MTVMTVVSRLAVLLQLKPRAVRYLGDDNGNDAAGDALPKRVRPPLDKEQSGIVDVVTIPEVFKHLLNV